MMILKSPPLQWHDILATQHWLLWVWALCGALFVFAETYAAIRGRKYATLTYIVKKGCPRWALALLFGWLAYHFFIES